MQPEVIIQVAVLDGKVGINVTGPKAGDIATVVMALAEAQKMYIQQAQKKHAESKKLVLPTVAMNGVRM